MVKTWFLVCVTLLASLLVVGCEGLGWVAKEDYQAVVAEHEVLVQENARVEGELEELESDLTNLQTDYDTLKGANDKLSADYEAASEELAEMKEVYPPRDFSSLRELQDWLIVNDVSERPASTTAENLYSKALEIQADALQDGYIVSVDLDPGERPGEWFIACVTVIDGDLWAWGPENDEPVNVSPLIEFVKVK